MAVVVMLWCQVVVCVTVVASSSGCHIASCNVAPLVSVNEEAGRGVVLLTWAGHDLAAIMSLLRCGGRSMVVVDGLCLDGGGGGKEEATTWQWSSHSCRIWEATCRGGLYGALVYHIAKPL